MKILSEMFISFFLLIVFSNTNYASSSGSGLQYRFAIYEVLGHENAVSFGRDKEVERRRIIFSDKRSEKGRNHFDAMRPEKYPLEGLILAEKPLLTEAEVESYNWTKHIIHLKPGVRERFPKPGVGGVPFVVVVDGKRLYMGAFWTSLSSYLANMPTISQDKWHYMLPETEPHYLPKNAIRIENGQVLQKGEKPRDLRNDEGVRQTMNELHKLIEPGSTADSVWGKTVNGLRCRIEPTRKRFLVDNPISFRITFENTGKKPINLRGVNQSHIYEAGEFYFNNQKVNAMPSMLLDSMIRLSISLNPNQSKVVLFTLSQWGIKDYKTPQTPGQYKVRFHYAGAMILGPGKDDAGFIKSQSLAEVVSNTIEIEIAKQPAPIEPEVEMESLKDTLEKLREMIHNNCYIFDTVIRGSVDEESKKYNFLLIHNPRTSKLGRKEAAEIVKWSLGGLVVAENDEYFLLVSKQTPKVKKLEELIAKISALLSLEANKIRRDMEHYLIEETRMVAREMGEKMVLTLHPGIMLKEFVSWEPEPNMEDLQKFILKYPEEKNWHAQLHGRIATSLKKKGQWGKAIDIYQKIIDEYGELALPMFPGRILAKDQAQLGMADCYRQMGNHEKALAILDNLRNQATSRMIRRTAEKEYAELYNKVFNQNRQ